MPLSSSLRSVDLTFECPACNYAKVESGAWFQAVGRFKCEGCQREVRLTYADKVALFEKHAHLGIDRGPATTKPRMATQAINHQSPSALRRKG